MDKIGFEKERNKVTCFLFLQDCLLFYIYFFLNKPKVIEFFFKIKKKESKEPPDRPVFSGSAPVQTFFPGSSATRFSGLTGPDSSPVPGSIGPTFINAHINAHIPYICHKY
jgi:hypothetical protein